MADPVKSGPVGSAKSMDPVEPNTSDVIARVFVKHHLYSEGTPLEVPGLGIVPNFGSKPVTTVDSMNYEVASSNKWPSKNGKPLDLILEYPPSEGGE